MSVRSALLCLAGFMALGAASPPGGTKASPSPDVGSEEIVFLVATEALAEIFPNHGAVYRELFELDDDQRKAVREVSGVAVPEGPVETFRVEGPNGVTRGYALVLDERGKYRPITFMVGLSPELDVVGVEVMVYREDRGSEVRRGRFLKQYRGKRAGDPIRTHRDIVNITGATISVNSINRGVRRALATAELLYGSPRAARPETSQRVDAGG